MLAHNEMRIRSQPQTHKILLRPEGQPQRHESSLSSPANDRVKTKAIAHHQSVQPNGHW